MLLTGGSRGIGAAVAGRAAAAGWAVCLTYRDDATAAAAVVVGIEREGGTAAAVQADISAEGDVLKAFAAAERLGPLGALVANAGIAAPKARVDEMSAERVERVFAVNVVGTIMCCREVVRRLSTSHGGPGGSIVLLSSAASRLGSPGEYVDYAASKAAVDTLTVGLAQEVAADGIRVNAVAPSLAVHPYLVKVTSEDLLAELASREPFGRAAEPWEVANVIVFLASDYASYMTGEVVSVSSQHP